MTNYTFSSQAQLTEFIENAPLYLMTSSGSWGGSNPTPFYYESASNTVNFGYGINLVVAAGDSQLKAEVNSVLAALSQPVTISASQWASLGSPNSSAATLQSITAALNAVAEQNGPSAIQAAAATLTQYKLNGSGYSNSAVAGLGNELSDFAQLTQDAQNGLEDLQYNAGGGFLGTAITSDLEETTPDYASAAYELAFATATPGNTTYESRSLIDAAQMLGLTVTIDGNYDITSLAGTSDAKTSTIVDFLQQVAQKNPASYLSTTSATDFMNALVSYLITQGFYVPQSSSETFSSIVAGNNLNGITLTGTQLQQMNAALPDSNLSAGGLVYVPIATTPATTSQDFNPPAQTGSGQAFVFDPTAGAVYTVAASLNPSTHDAGKLFIESPASGSAAIFEAGSYEQVSYTSNVLSVAITDQSGATIGTFTSTIADDNNFDVSTGASATTITVTGTGELDTTSADTDLTGDMLVFDGHSIAGAVNPSTFDQYGRSYSLSGATLTISGAGGSGADTLTIRDFQDGDFGVNFPYAFTAIAPAGSVSTDVTGINNNGEIIGFDSVSVGPDTVSAEQFTDSGGTFSTIADSPFYSPGGISNSGAIVGFGAGFELGDVNSYIDNNGVFSGIVDPANPFSTEVTGISENGLIVGDGFVDNGGAFTAISGPISFFTGINNSGVIVGDSVDNAGIEHGVVDNGGVFTAINDPSGTNGTAVTGINDDGVIVGYYTDSSGVLHGFVDNGGVFTTIDAPGAGAVGAEGAAVTGINDSGEIVGVVYNVNGDSSFSATPQTPSRPTESINQSNSSVTVASGTNAGVYGSGNTVTAANNNNIAVYGNNNAVTVASGSYIGLSGSSETGTINGSGSTINVTGTNTIAYDLGTGDDTISVGGSSNGANIHGSGDTVTVTGTGVGINDLATGNTTTLNGSTETAAIYGSGGTINVTGTNSIAYDLGTGDDSISVGGSSNGANIHGSGDTVTATGSGVGINDFGTGNTTTLNGASETAAIYGSGDTIHVTGTNSIVYDLGTGHDTISVGGSSNGANIHGTSDTVTVTGTGVGINDFGTGNSTSINGASETAAIYGSGDTIHVTGTNNIAYDLGTGDDTITVGGSSDGANIHGTGDTVTVTGTGVGINDFGTGNTTSINGASETAAIYGSGDTIHVAGTNSIAYDLGTGGDTITVGGSSNGANIHGSADTVTATGSGVGINDFGTGNTTTLSGGSENATLIGSSDTVNITGTNSIAYDVSTGNNAISLTGSNDNGDIYNGSGSDTLTIGGTSNTMNVLYNLTGGGTATIGGTNALLEFYGASADSITFADTTSGILKLNAASSFAGTVAGLADGDAIDLANFLFSGTPTISSVTGTGAAGTATDVTVHDGSQSVTLALLNQFANQFAVNASAYALTADSTAGNAGTLLQLAASH